MLPPPFHFCQISRPVGSPTLWRLITDLEQFDLKFALTLVWDAVVERVSRSNRMNKYHVKEVERFQRMGKGTNKQRKVVTSTLQNGEKVRIAKETEMSGKRFFSYVYKMENKESINEVLCCENGIEAKDHQNMVQNPVELCASVFNRGEDS